MLSRGAEIDVQGLTKTFVHGAHGAYGERQLPILKGINLVLRAGEMVSVVGASGVGKSTLLHCLGTLDLPTSGRILFGGIDLGRLGPTQLAEFRNRTIGFVFQFHHLLPGFTALENTMMPALIARFSRADAERRAREILERVGLGERLSHKPGELSGGEQQRVALARALVMRPRLILADEPTGNLDAQTGSEIHELFFELNREHGTTMMIVTHNPELAARMPRQLRMMDGRIESDAGAPS